jgi:hypothetical protein
MSLHTTIGSIAICATALLFPCNAQLFEMNGYVSDLNGKAVSGATVLIKNAGQTAVTTVDGRFSFDALVKVKFSGEKTAADPVPLLKSDGLYFSVHRDAVPVTIDFFTLAGKKAFTVVNKSMAPGNYRMPLLSTRAGPQMCVMRARIGGTTACFRVPVVHNGRTAIPSVKKLPDILAPAPVAKKSEALDTLVVTANGFLRNARPLDSYLGSHYVVLKTAAQSAKKLLTLTCALNQGTTDNDPQVTLCTAIWAQDLGRDYVTTLFVTQWLSEEGYRYPNLSFSICPDWRGPDSTRWTAIRKTDTALVDAVTKATPMIGNASFDFNPLAFGLQPAAAYRFCIEVNIEANYQILFTDSLTLGDQPLVRTPAPQYIPAKDPTATVDGISGLTMWYR